jgi:hypothetical protein
MTEAAEVIPTEPTAAEVAVEEKAVKPRAKRTRKAKPPAAVEKEETNATAKTGEIQKES